MSNGGRKTDWSSIKTTMVSCMRASGVTGLGEDEQLQCREELCAKRPSWARRGGRKGKTLFGFFRNSTLNVDRMVSGCKWKTRRRTEDFTRWRVGRETFPFEEVVVLDKRDEVLRFWSREYLSIISAK